MSVRYRFLKNFVYRMKMRYGEPVTVVHFSGTTTDYDTGQIVQNATEQYVIQRAIVFPRTESIKFEYDLSFIAVNKNFTYGGQFVTNTGVIMLDRGDLGPAFSPTISDEVSFRNQRYVIEKIQDYEEGRILFLDIKRLEAL